MFPPEPSRIVADEKGPELDSSELEQTIRIGCA
jgi:hypothetical protein